MKPNFIKDANSLGKIGVWISSLAINIIYNTWATDRKLTKRVSPNCKLAKIFKSHPLCCSAVCVQD